MFYVHKDYITKDIRRCASEEIEALLNNGWKPGKHPSHWITDGTINKLLKEGLPMPPGFKFGQSEEFKSKNSVGSKRRWEYMTDEEKALLSQKVSKSIKHMWENLSEEDKQSRESHRAATRATWTEEKIQKYKKHMSDSAKKERATRSLEQYKLSSNKGFKTRKLKGNVNTSNQEEILFNLLLEKYPGYTIYRNYIDKERYPFHCDFYIKELDLFIELNAHWTHGGKPFDPSDQDCLNQLNNWEQKSKNSNFYKIAIDVWTNKDVEKLRVAKTNNLNYKILFSFDEIENV